MAQAVESQPSGSGTVDFELERLVQADGRLDLSGRWFGVRGRRFVRPTLTFELRDRPYRLLADLEHKPWFAEDGEPWMAAFPWDGGTDGLQQIELNVAPDISIELTESGTRVRGSARTGRLPNAHARAESMRQEVQALRRELANERQVSERLREQLDPVRVQLDAQRTEAKALRDEVERLRDEKVRSEAVLVRQEAALTRLAEVEKERDAGRKAVDQANAERDDLQREHRQAELEHERTRTSLAQLRADLDAAREAHDRLLADRDQALRVRDQALTERDRALSERDELARVGESVQSQRAAARALVDRRNLAWRGSPWIAPGRSSAARHPEILRREVGWMARLAALALLIVAIVVMLVVLHVL
jgi:hypothetical protein